MRFNKFKSGKTVDFKGVNCFIPNTIISEIDFTDNEIDLLLSKASWYLGKLNALSNYLPDTQLFFSMLMFQEAKKSNEIEGTMTEMKGVGDPIAESKYQPENKKVLNYLDAFNYGVEYLKSNEFTEELINELHIKLFKDIDNKTLKAGKYKEEQNWVGGATKYDARFIPPPPKETKRLMDDLIDFMNDDELEMADLIKIGIIHYQFETIHPFNDGNGRLGRMLVGLYLIKKQIIEHPLFISNFLSRYRREYYFNLDSVRYKNEMEQWIKFFLIAIKEATKDTLLILDRVITLKKEVEQKILKEFKGSSTFPIQIMKMLYKTPFITSTECTKEIGFSVATANTILKSLEKLGIIEEITKQKRNKVYLFEEYLKIFKNELT
mgnify:CR=1 FL=1